MVPPWLETEGWQNRKVRFYKDGEPTGWVPDSGYLGARIEATGWQPHFSLSRRIPEKVMGCTQLGKPEGWLHRGYGAGPGT